VRPGQHILDCGCGIGGPARNIHRFSGAKVTAVTLNQGQVNRGNQLCAKEGVAGMVKLVQADFMQVKKRGGHVGVKLWFSESVVGCGQHVCSDKY
jgi:cyclopropane fatty-acyl-phospholipid synthase-like methyltransferase